MNRFIYMTTLIVALVVMTGATTAFAQAPDEADVPAVGDVQILEVTGRAAQFTSGQRDANDNLVWAPLTTESKLGVGSQIRTLPGTTVKLRVGPSNLVTIRGMGTLGIAALSVDEDAKLITARLAQEYGRMRVEVSQVGDFLNDTQVATPGQNMAVKGTRFDVFAFGSFSSCRGNEGRVRVNRKHDVGAGDESSTHSPDPTKNAGRQSNTNNTSTPSGDGDNASDNDPNLGFGGLGTNDTKGVANGYDAWHQSVQTFINMTPGDDGGGDDDDPPL